MSVAAFDGNDRNIVFCILVLTFSILSAISSLIVIYLIRKMNMTNGHSLLIWTMSWFQLIYDISFFNAVIPVGVDAIYEIANILQIIGGISSSLTSNIIAMISYYVVKNTKSVDVLRYYNYILAGVLFPSIVNSILYAMSCFPKYAYLRDISTLDVYYYIRVASILFNFALCFMTYMQIRKISSKSAGGGRTIPEEAIRTLAYRLMYYPIIQAVSRSAVAWYEVKYHYDFNPSGASKDQFIAQCFMAILTPSASFGYLVVFLLMQPNAWECFKSTLLCRTFRAKPSGSLSSNLLNIQRFSQSNAVKLGSPSPNKHVQDSSNHDSLSQSAGSGAQSHHSLLSGYDEQGAVFDDSDTSQISLRYSFRMSQKDDEELWELIATNSGTDLWNTTPLTGRQNSQESSQATTSLLYHNYHPGGSSVSGGVSASKSAGHSSGGGGAFGASGGNNSSSGAFSGSGNRPGSGNSFNAIS